MKYILLIIVSVLLFSCNSNEVTISRQEYESLKGKQFTEKIKPINWVCSYTIIEIKQHEFIFMETLSSYGGIALAHYPDCNLCKQKEK